MSECIFKNIFSFYHVFDYLLINGCATSANTHAATNRCNKTYHLILPCPRIVAPRTVVVPLIQSQLLQLLVFPIQDSSKWRTFIAYSIIRFSRFIHESMILAMVKSCIQHNSRHSLAVFYFTIEASVYSSTYTHPLSFYNFVIVHTQSFRYSF